MTRETLEEIIMRIADESRRFTAADFEQVRLGVFQLRGHHVYAADADLREPCDQCDGTGKTLHAIAPGRKVSRPCGACSGRRLVSPLRNVEWKVPGPAWGRVATASNLEELVDSLNHDPCRYLEQPTYVRLNPSPTGLDVPLWSPCR
jgi:hypothetical protein